MPESATPEGTGRAWRQGRGCGWGFTFRDWDLWPAENNGKNTADSTGLCMRSWAGGFQKT